MVEKIVQINGMSCNHCVMAVKKELSKLQIESSEVTIGSAKIVFDETKVAGKQIEDAIAEAGFTIVK